MGKIAHPQNFIPLKFELYGNPIEFAWTELIQYMTQVIHYKDVL